MEDFAKNLQPLWDLEPTVIRCVNWMIRCDAVYLHTLPRGPLRSQLSEGWNLDLYHYLRVVVPQWDGRDAPLSVIETVRNILPGERKRVNYDEEK